jgi:glyoxylase-like metal-dependent hydrolase (beta-lactamase superfamily II)
MQELRPGLFRWTERHAEWTPDQGGPDGWDPEVSSYLYESSDALVLFDPLLPAGSPAWEALEERVSRVGAPHVLLTIHFHVRSTPEIVRRYPGTRVWALDRTPWIEESRERVDVTDPFELDDELPAGIGAHAPREAVYWVPEHAALVAGDVLLGTPDGGVRQTPWLAKHRSPEQLRANLLSLLELPIELILLMHGEPILENGREVLARALEA